MAVQGPVEKQQPDELSHRGAATVSSFCSLLQSLMIVAASRPLHFLHYFPISLVFDKLSTGACAEPPRCFCLNQ